MGRLPSDAFIEGFPNGLVALVKQTNGKYRLIVSRPGNKPDGILADAEANLLEILEYANENSKLSEADDD